MKKKLIIFSLSLLGVLLYYAAYNPRYFGLCQVDCKPYINKYQDMSLIFPYIFLFSLLTLKSRLGIFEKWWRFSRIAIPVILVISFAISLELHHTAGGYMNFNHTVDYLAFNILNATYTLGSFIAIYRGYRQNKLGGTGLAAGKRVGDGGRVI